MNPGSPEAVQSGCTCSVKDNHNGRGVVMGEQYAHWTEKDCPLHGENEMNCTWPSCDCGSSVKNGACCQISDKRNPETGGAE